jgi:hypothetical protein
MHSFQQTWSISMRQSIPLRFSVFAGVSAVLALSPAAEALTYLDGTHGAVSVAKAESSFNPVGAVKLFDDGGEFLGHGSGALITTPDAPGTSPNHWFLTAAHVVANADSVAVAFGDQFDDEDGTDDVAAASWYVPSSYDGNVVSESDIALIRLDTELSLETFGPYSIFPHTDMREIDNVYHMVGFGTSGTGISGQVVNDGRKRTGRNKYEYTGGLNDVIVYSDFDVDYPRDTLSLGAPGEPNEEWRIARETSSAQGDSGGPQLMGDNIVSITSFGPAPLFNTTFGDVRTAPWAQWIADVINDVDNLGGDGSTVVSGVFGDGAVEGMPGTPIEIDGGDDDDVFGGISNFQYYSQLLIRYADPDDPMNQINDVMRLAGLSKRAETIDYTEAAARLQGYGLDPEVTDEEEVLTYAQELLDQSLANLPLDELVNVNAGELGHYGFLRGLADPTTYNPHAPAPVLLPGDTNMDGEVDLLDLQNLADAWDIEGDPDAESVAEAFLDWFNGDFNGDFDVDEFDLAVLAANWTQTDQTFAQAVATVDIPEPTSLALLGFAGAVLAVRRRKA